MKNFRVKYGEHYFTIDRFLKIRKFIDIYEEVDYELHKIGNYYGTREQAEAAVEQLKTVFQNSH